MKKQLPTVVLITVLAVLTSCVANRQLHTLKTSALPPLAMAYQVQQITIVDERADTTSDKMPLPFISVPNQFIMHIPALTPEHKTLIEKTIRENTTDTGTPVGATVIIEEAYKGFSATSVSEGQKGYARLQVSFHSMENAQPLTGCFSNGAAFIRSLDATHKKMEQVYRAALKNALYNCLKCMNETAEN